MKFAKEAAKLGRRCDRFAQWLQSNGLSSEPNVHFNRTSMGTGLVAARSIAPGEEILCVPQSVWGPFSADRARAEATVAAPAFVDHIRAVEEQLVGAVNVDASASTNFQDSVLLAMQLLLKVPRLLHAVLPFGRRTQTSDQVPVPVSVPSAAASPQLARRDRLSTGRGPALRRLPLRRVRRPCPPDGHAPDLPH